MFDNLLYCHECNHHLSIRRQKNNYYLCCNNYRYNKDNCTAHGFNYKRLEKRKDSILNNKIKDLFKEYNFMIDNGKEEYINYKDLYKVIERDNTYYLYINKYKAFIVSKEGISKNNIEKLSNNFKDKVSTYKYIK